MQPMPALTLALLHPPQPLECRDVGTRRASFQQSASLFEEMISIVLAR